MADRPDDRPKRKPSEATTVDPKIFVVIDGESFPRPALETFFAEAPADMAAASGGCSCHPVLVPVCTCNRVCSCVPVCGCDAHTTTCSCVGHTSGGGTYCQCAPVH